jgi:uracil-DNA glycosylase
MGMSFSVPSGIKLPPSLKNIYKEIADDIGIDTSQRNGDLTHWAKQGILLLNSALTVREGKTNSHQKYWIDYTNKILEIISQKTDNVVFILWGRVAQTKSEIIDKNKHHIITGTHPSPLSASKGFFGCKHFSKCNEILIKQGRDIIIW